MQKDFSPKNLFPGDYPKSKFQTCKNMPKFQRRRVAEEAARFIVEGCEAEYLHAKERAISMLGLSSSSHLPSNRKIKDCIARLTASQLGDEEVKRRITEMRRIAAEIMEVIPDADPFLIGSTLTGQIRDSSDIDLHAYSDDYTILKNQLLDWGYEEIEEEIVDNRKGRFVHLKWHENEYPVEITVYPWSWRDVVLNSSVTGKPMKRADINALKALLKRS
jgi:predicted nucleotidyltransferase